MNSKVLQYEVYRRSYNQKGLDERRKRGKKAGKLRWKPPQRFRSFTYNQIGFWLIPGNNKLGTLQLSKIGEIPILLHREIVGDIKGVTIKHVLSGDWYVIFWVDDGKSEEKLTFVEKAVGIDVGLEHYAVDSDGLETENPRNLKCRLKKLRRDQRRLSRKKKGSKNYEKQRTIVARDHEKVENQRSDFLHKLSKYYVDNYDLIVTEKLDIKDLIENSHMAQSISDAAWGTFNQMLTYKAERAGSCSSRLIPGERARNAPDVANLSPKHFATDSTTALTVDCRCRVIITLPSISSNEVLRRYGRNDRNLRLWTDDLYLIEDGAC